MAALRLMQVPWQWAQDSEQAAWWIVDSSAGSDVAALAARYDQLERKPKVAFLAGHMKDLPRTSWAFFQRPVRSAIIHNWVRPHVGEHGVASISGALPEARPDWRQGWLRLRKWPNVSRYGNRLELTIACSRMLAAPMSYAQVVELGISESLLDQLLADAHRDGLLQFSGDTPAQREDGSDGPGAGAPGRASGERPRWNLIDRLLSRFSAK